MGRKFGRCNLVQSPTRPNLAFDSRSTRLSSLNHKLTGTRLILLTSHQTLAKCLAGPTAPNTNRAFSCDVMLSSNMAASIATAINIHLCKHLFTLLCVMVSPRTSPFVVQAHDDRVCAWCA